MVLPDTDDFDLKISQVQTKEYKIPSLRRTTPVFDKKQTNSQLLSFSGRIDNLE